MGGRDRQTQTERQRETETVRQRAGQRERTSIKNIRIADTVCHHENDFCIKMMNPPMSGRLTVSVILGSCTYQTTSVKSDNR